MSEGDGVDEAFAGLGRVALTAAGRAIEEIARAREQNANRAAAESQQAGQEVAARFEAEREGARAALAVTRRDDWWASATVDDVRLAQATARAWSEVDPVAKADYERITAEAERRTVPKAGESTEAAAVVMTADRLEEGEYDSRERREGLRQEANKVTSAEVASSRVVADTAQGAPAADAVRAARSSALKARRSRLGAGRVASRSEQAR